MELFATRTASHGPGSHHLYAVKVITQEDGQLFAKVLLYRLDMAFQLSRLKLFAKVLLYRLDMAFQLSRWNNVNGGQEHAVSLAAWGRICMRYEPPSSLLVAV